MRGDCPAFGEEPPVPVAGVPGRDDEPLGKRVQDRAEAGVIPFPQRYRACGKRMWKPQSPQTYQSVITPLTYPRVDTPSDSVAVPMTLSPWKRREGNFPLPKSPSMPLLPARFATLCSNWFADSFLNGRTFLSCRSKTAVGATGLSALAVVCQSGCRVRSPTWLRFRRSTIGCQC
jgi:hypothetical protein